MIAFPAHPPLDAHGRKRNALTLYLPNLRLHRLLEGDGSPASSPCIGTFADPTFPGQPSPWGGGPPPGSPPTRPGCRPRVANG